MTSLSSVRTRVRLFNVAVHGSLVLHEICRSSDLVNTCYQDLQRLIEFCSEHVAFLTSRDDILSHVNGIIDTASNVLSAACQVLERFRTGTRRGSKTSLHMRIEWLTTGSHEFRNLEPVIRQHHAAVLTELGSLRSMAMAPPPEWEELDDGKENTTRHSNDAMERAVFDNLALLGDIIGDSFAGIQRPRHVR
ncbi:hypothetical protein O9K51_09314 [Purpureocillium lavendulum]|uniref:Fungal N-terminal domain-containing protein n=1 Tax=Purpureocillium lavendulum TaxID=1247861 RepID=A0AB34FI43_9HYPO|nr:hypothetical protein O9K51_09314 [Purpureocillium lavendulum]